MVYSISLGGSKKKTKLKTDTQKSPIKPTFRFGRRFGRRNQRLQKAIDIYRIIQRWRS